MPGMREFWSQDACIKPGPRNSHHSMKGVWKIPPTYQGNGSIKPSILEGKLFASGTSTVPGSVESHKKYKILLGSPELIIFIWCLSANRNTLGLRRAFMPLRSSVTWHCLPFTPQGASKPPPAFVPGLPFTLTQ